MTRLLIVSCSKAKRHDLRSIEAIERYDGPLFRLLRRARSAGLLIDVLDEPYQIEWLLSYCDTRLHRGTIYAAAGFERYRVNDRGIETWRIRLPALTAQQCETIRMQSLLDPRAIGYRARRQVRQERMFA